MLHDLGLTSVAPARERFEIEGADAARSFLSRHGMSDRALDTVWDAIALHTTMAIPQRKCADTGRQSPAEQRLDRSFARWVFAAPPVALARDP